MTTASAASSTGRPRGFDMDVALRAALSVFWRHGYAATSLDDLTGAMGRSRSSFYAAVGSKHDVLLAAVTSYADGVFAELEEIAASSRSPTVALRAVLDTMARPSGGSEGCLLVNSVTELAPDDIVVCEIARTHIARVTSLIGALLVRAGHRSDTSADLSGALLSATFGITTLRKAGLPTAALAGFLAQLERLLELPG